MRKLMGTPGYIIDKGMIRRHTATDPWPKPPPVTAGRGLYRNGRQTRVALPVDADLLRGSGVPIPAAAAGALEMVPGEHATFTGEHALVALAWRLSSNRGPTLGSVRVAAETLAAAADDSLVLGFDNSDHTVTVTHERSREGDIDLVVDGFRKWVRLAAAATRRS